MAQRYNTGNQRPSNSMKDLNDNALVYDDFLNGDADEVIDRLGKSMPTIRKTIRDANDKFHSQITLQDSLFLNSQIDKENRFASFLDSSGYVFLGDYQNGPFQFSARNQYIRYNNQYYRLNTATDVGFTTTGTDATSFANDVTHFVLMDGDTLRQNLGSSEGFGLVGKCPNISTLRTIEPSYSGQSIILEKCDADGVLLNVQLHHDPYDIFSPDDGFSVFVTPGGARWKPDLTHGYNVALAGLKRDLSNLADCFDRVRDSIINRIKANGRVNNILCKIMIPSVSFVTNYKIDHPLVYPSIITLTALGNVYIEPKEGMHFQPVVAGDNSQFTSKLTKAMFQAEAGWQGATSKYLNQASARVILDCVGGVLTIRGPGYALEYTDKDGDPVFDANGNPTLDTTGLSIGNMAPCDLDCRDVVVQNVSVIGFNKAFVWGTYNTFICGLRNVYFSRVYDGVTIPDGISNSGERMWYDNVTFGNVARHAFVGLSAGEHTLHNCSVDFVGKDLFYNGPNSACSFVWLC
ncbi:hypothetical protein [Klebsiella quasipneumoniae]|uniref:hypothetical protein n=1 Tax=Klebsiella quasipneumoniae TaxID=1463165 RepID=UPI003510193B